ncbi:MAG: cyclic pyranopterin monophosphate synthase MoaC [Candidatus Korarchaeota archaeon]|nr:cyclic pyranopterin monophosphate synthase MoaC [Candidatus Korarchaeota archaeon]NIU82672.1 cyclic pyranopterin monophosphate synthase MoaC [Candidatus Thorarchaeota archaeon]NIW51301.1 cyclic pyranopterin monophosphate synthase MoaC [Candidatus Korarchaeota archaeon]
MVDVSDKPVVKRIAEAEGEIWLRPKTIREIRKGNIEKGDVFSTATIAGILAAKRTPDLIPLCHTIPLSKVDIQFSVHDEYVTTKCMVIGEYKTGVEMEALAGATTALLTIWDMVKYLEKDEEGQYPHTKITKIKVLKKEISKK